MKVEIIDGWPAYPVSLNEAKAALGIDDEFRDGDLMSALATACETIEGRIDLALTRRTYRGWLDGWPCRKPGRKDFVELPFAPAVSLTSVTTYDADSVATIMPTTDYLFSRSNGGGPGQPPSKGGIVLKGGATWPTVGLEADGICIEWVAGFEDVGRAPEPVRRAIIVLAKHLFDSAEGPEPEAVNNLLRHIRGLRV